MESSGLSRAAFCRRHRINYQTMTSWVKRFRDEGVPASGNIDAAGFVEVSPFAVTRASAAVGMSEAVGTGASPYEVMLGGNRSIRVGGDFDGDVLARLIRVLLHSYLMRSLEDGSCKRSNREWVASSIGGTTPMMIQAWE